MAALSIAVVGFGTTGLALVSTPGLPGSPSSELHVQSQVDGQGARALARVAAGIELSLAVAKQQQDPDKRAQLLRAAGDEMLVAVAETEFGGSTLRLEDATDPGFFEQAAVLIEELESAGGGQAGDSALLRSRLSEACLAVVDALGAAAPDGGQQALDPLRFEWNLAYMGHQLDTGGEVDVADFALRIDRCAGWIATIPGEAERSQGAAALSELSDGVLLKLQQDSSWLQGSFEEVDGQSEQRLESLSRILEGGPSQSGLNAFAQQLETGLVTDLLSATELAYELRAARYAHLLWIAERLHGYATDRQIEWNASDQLLGTMSQCRPQLREAADLWVTLPGRDRYEGLLQSKPDFSPSDLLTWQGESIDLSATEFEILGRGGARTRLPGAADLGHEEHYPVLDGLDYRITMPYGPRPSGSVLECYVRGFDTSSAANKGIVYIPKSIPRGYRLFSNPEWQSTPRGYGLISERWTRLQLASQIVRRLGDDRVGPGDTNPLCSMLSSQELLGVDREQLKDGPSREARLSAYRSDPVGKKTLLVTSAQAATLRTEICSKWSVAEFPYLELRDWLAAFGSQSSEWPEFANALDVVVNNSNSNWQPETGDSYYMRSVIYLQPKN